MFDMRYQLRETACKLSLIILLLLTAFLSSRQETGAQVTARNSSPQAEEVINRWAQALGGRKKLGRIRNIYTLSTTVEGGLAGELKEWTATKGQHKRIYTRTGVDSTTTVY